MTRKTRAVTARLFLGAFLLGSPLLAGCGGGGSSGQIDQFAPGASITKQAHVISETGTFLGPEVRTIYFLRDADGHNYFPTTLDAAFLKDGLSVQFSATVISNSEGATDGPTGINITLTNIHAL